MGAICKRTGEGRGSGFGSLGREREHDSGVLSRRKRFIPTDDLDLDTTLFDATKRNATQHNTTQHKCYRNGHHAKGVFYDNP